MFKIWIILVMFAVVFMQKLQGIFCFHVEYIFLLRIEIFSNQW